MFNVAIIGGENYGKYAVFEEYCIKILKNKAKSGEGITILSTGDDFVDKFAKKFGIAVRIFYCDWKANKRNALKVRNYNLLEHCNAIIMFNDGLKDTNTLFNMAVEKEIPNRKIG